MSGHARCRDVLCVLIAAIAGCASAAPGGARPGDIAAVTFNIYHDRADWPKRMRLVVEGLRALQPDVVALQEVLQHDALPNQAQAIADALGYHLHFVSADPVGASRRYGNAILTPHPILAHGGCRLEPAADGRTLAHARLAIHGAVVDVFATHLHHEQHGTAIRRQQAQGVLAAIDATSDPAVPVMLLGDFNAPVGDAGLAPLQARLTDAYGSRHGIDAGPPAHATLNPAYFAATARIDHVFVERGRFDVLEAGVVFDRAGADGTWPSDHFGVHARLRPTVLDSGRSPAAARRGRGRPVDADAAAACRRAGLSPL